MCQWVAHWTKIITSCISNIICVCFSSHLFPNSSTLEHKYFRSSNTQLNALEILRLINVEDHHLATSTRTLRVNHLNISLCVANTLDLIFRTKTLSVCSVNRCATRLPWVASRKPEKRILEIEGRPRDLQVSQHISLASASV